MALFVAPVEIVKILIDNEELRLKVRRQQEELEKERKESEEQMEEKVEFETALLQQRIKQLVRDSEDEKQRNQLEKNVLEEDRRDLETRLDMLRTEFDRLDEYWQVSCFTTVHPFAIPLYLIEIFTRISYPVQVGGRKRNLRSRTRLDRRKVSIP